MDGAGKETLHPEEDSPEVKAFKEELSRADGTLIPLRKTTSEGKKIYIAARRLTNPANSNISNPTANPNFWGWEESRYKPRKTDVLLIDTYIEHEGRIVPLGHMDWWIHEDYANGGGNMHEAAQPQSEHEQHSAGRWHDSIAFKVDYEYHRQGVGSLMLAAAGVVLPAIGIKKFYSGGILEPAVRTYARFGIAKEDFYKKSSKSDEAHLPVERLSQNPVTESVLSDFV